MADTRDKAGRAGVFLAEGHLRSLCISVSLYF